MYIILLVRNYGLFIESIFSDVDVPTKKTFVTCTKYLKVLAKFLGFVETLPYKSDATNYSENLLQTHISIRQQVSFLSK